MQSRCAALNCESGKFNKQPLFRFPKDEERCRKWVENCNRSDLMDKSPEQLFKYYRLCGKHFGKASFENNDTLVGLVLTCDAVPSIFDAPNPPQATQLKRSKETVEGDETENDVTKKGRKSQTETTADGTEAPSEEEEHKQFLTSLFEAVLLLAEQNVPAVKGPVDGETKSLASSNLLELLDYRVSAGDQILRRRCDADPESKEMKDKEFCSPGQLARLIDVCEQWTRSKILDQVKMSRLFSLVTGDVAKIADEWHLPVFLLYMDQTNFQQQRFAGFLNFEGDGDSLAERLLSEMTDQWGLDMDQCRGQAHAVSSSQSAKIKAFAAKLKERYPMAVLTPRSTHALNISLVGGAALSGVQLVMLAFKKIEAFFIHSPALQLELEHAISIFYPDKEEKANELKELCRTSWTTRPEAFDTALDLMESLLLCVDSVHDNEDLRWSDDVTQQALEISKALADFEFVMSLVVLKSTLVLTRAFGKNLQGSAAEAYSAASNFKPMLQSLTEVSENIDVYHEFWYDEAVNLASSLEIPVRVPRSSLKRCPSESGTTALQPQGYFKENLSVPVLNHIIKEMQELFGEDHLKSLSCLSLVPAVLAQNKTTEPKEESLQIHKADIPNMGTLPAELHCWWVKWSQKAKGEPTLSNVHETLRMADVKFFPNMFAVLRVIGTLPSLVLEDSCSLAYRRFHRYLENTPENLRSRSLALVNVNIDVGRDLGSMVEAYMKSYPGGEDI